MKIAICGSFAFARQMVSAAKKLTEMGHLPILPIDTMAAIEDISIIYDVNRAIEKDIIRDQLSKIIESDAILVLNYDRSGVPGYIGGSSLIEMGFAYYFKKKIFLLFPIPDLSYKIDIEFMQPVILSGNLEQLK